MTRPELRSLRRSIARLLNQVGVSVFRGAVLWRVVLIVAGLLVGPGGVSVFN